VAASVDLLGLAVSVVAGAASSRFGPVVRDQFARRSDARRTARVKKIEDAVAFISRLQQEPSAASAYVGMLMLKTVLPSALAAIFSVVTVYLPAGKHGQPSIDQYVAGAAAFVTLAFGAYAASRAVSSCRSIYDPPWYDERTARQLRKLTPRAAVGPAEAIAQALVRSEQDSERDQDAATGPAWAGPGAAPVQVPPPAGGPRTGTRPERTDLT
jgi:hypothetical protein